MECNRTALYSMVFQLNIIDFYAYSNDTHIQILYLVRLFLFYNTFINFRSSIARKLIHRNLPKSNVEAWQSIIKRSHIFVEQSRYRKPPEPDSVLRIWMLHFDCIYLEFVLIANLLFSVIEIVIEKLKEANLFDSVT